MALPNPAFHEEAQKRYTRDADGLWQLGMYPEASADQLKQLQELLLQRKHVAAYTLSHLPGHSGVVPPFRLELEETPVPAVRHNLTGLCIDLFCLTTLLHSTAVL